MKIVIYSDLHLYNHHNLIINVETGLSVLDYLKNYCLSNNIDQLVCAGDFFHSKSKIHTTILVQAWLKIKEIYKKKINHTILIGNHDLAVSTSTMNSALFLFSDYANIISDYHFMDFEEVRIHFLSFFLEKFNNFIFSSTKKNILITHSNIKGFLMNNSIISNEGYSLEDFSKFDLVINGHYHKYQHKNNVVIVGSPYQISFGEADFSTGFLVLDTHTLKWEHKEIKNTPKYKLVEVRSLKDLKEQDLKNNFVKIKLINNEIDKESIRDVIVKYGALNASIISDINFNSNIKEESNLLLNTPREIIENYLQSLQNLDLDKKKLILYFNNIENYTGDSLDDN